MCKEIWWNICTTTSSGNTSICKRNDGWMWKMILGSDSHTRYGALGTMAIGEGGPEIVKQLLGKTYDINMPDIIGVYLTGSPQRGVGPQDIALTIIGSVFANGYVNNKVMEFVW